MTKKNKYTACERRSAIMDLMAVCQGGMVARMGRRKGYKTVCYVSAPILHWGKRLQQVEFYIKGDSGGGVVGRIAGGQRVLVGVTSLVGKCWQFLSNGNVGKHCLKHCSSDCWFHPRQWLQRHWKGDFKNCICFKKKLLYFLSSFFYSKLTTCFRNQDASRMTTRCGFDD